MKKVLKILIVLHQLGFKIDAFLRGNDRGQVLEKLDSSEFEDWDSVNIFP